MCFKFRTKGQFSIHNKLFFFFFPYQATGEKIGVFLSEGQEISC